MGMNKSSLQFPPSRPDRAFPQRRVCALGGEMYLLEGRDLRIKKVDGSHSVLALCPADSPANIITLSGEDHVLIRGDRHLIQAVLKWLNENLYRNASARPPYEELAAKCQQEGES